MLLWLFRYFLSTTFLCHLYHTNIIESMTNDLMYATNTH